MPSVEITADDLPIESVLDQYYTYLKALVGDSGSGNHKTYLFNTITPFDIYADCPLYNECVFANHANLVAGVSPVVIGEGGVSLSDSFSRYYADAVKLSLRKLEAGHLSADDLSRITALENNIQSERDRMLSINEQVAQGWAREAAASCCNSARRAEIN